MELARSHQHASFTLTEDDDILNYTLKLGKLINIAVTMILQTGYRVGGFSPSVRLNSVKETC